MKSRRWLVSMTRGPSSGANEKSLPFLMILSFGTHSACDCGLALSTVVSRDNDPFFFFNFTKLFERFFYTLSFRSQLDCVPFNYRIPGFTLRLRGSIGSSPGIRVGVKSSGWERTGEMAPLLISAILQPTGDRWWQIAGWTWATFTTNGRGGVISANFPFPAGKDSR